jgi:hypothetical protein
MMLSRMGDNKPRQKEPLSMEPAPTYATCKHLILFVTAWRKDGLTGLDHAVRVLFFVEVEVRWKMNPLLYEVALPYKHVSGN